MTTASRRHTTSASPARTLIGWLLVAAAAGVNVAVYRGAATQPWVWLMAIVVVTGAGMLRARSHRR